MLPHTPTPWEHGQYLWSIDAEGIEVAQANTVEDAAFIVRACNAHEDLLAACEALEASLLAAFEEKPKLFEQAITLAHAAIAKAKASGPA